MSNFKKFISGLVWVLLLLWQIPQTVVALLWLLINEIFSKPTARMKKRATRYCYVNTPLMKNFGVCLGHFVFMNESGNEERDERMERHEYGHSVQSLMFGPIFLIAVGIPSVILLCIKKTRNKSYEWYHSHYPENWADRLGDKYTPKEESKNDNSSECVAEEANICGKVLGECKCKHDQTIAEISAKQGEDCDCGECLQCKIDDNKKAETNSQE